MEVSFHILTHVTLMKGICFSPSVKPASLWQRIQPSVRRTLPIMFKRPSDLNILSLADTVSLHQQKIGGANLVCCVLCNIAWTKNCCSRLRRPRGINPWGSKSSAFIRKLHQLQGPSICLGRLTSWALWRLIQIKQEGKSQVSDMYFSVEKWHPPTWFVCSMRKLPKTPSAKRQQNPDK